MNNSITNKVSKIPDTYKDELRNMLKKININMIMPKNQYGKSKRIYDCTGKEILDTMLKNKDMINLCNKLDEVYCNFNDTLGELMLGLRNQTNPDTMDAYLLALACMYAMNEMIFTEILKNNPMILEPKQNNNLNNELYDMISDIINMEIKAKEEYCEKYKKKQLPLSEQRYYDGMRQGIIYVSKKLNTDNV